MEIKTKQAKVKILNNKVELKLEWTNPGKSEFNFNELEFFYRSFVATRRCNAMHKFTQAMRLQLSTFLVVYFYMIIHQSITSRIDNMHRINRIQVSSNHDEQKNYLLRLIHKVSTGKFISIINKSKYFI